MLFPVTHLVLGSGTGRHCSGTAVIFTVTLEFVSAADLDLRAGVVRQIFRQEQEEKKDR